MKSEAVSIRTFCKRTKAAPSTVGRWARDGRLPRSKGGKLLWPDAQLVWLEAQTAKADDDAATKELRSQLLRAQLREREAKADLQRLELQRELGELVPIVEVVADARACAEVIRACLLAIPARVGLQAEAIVSRMVAEAGLPPGSSPKAPVLERMIDDEINAALEALHKTRLWRQEK